jgi:hypothetical protein
MNKNQPEKKSMPAQDKPETYETKSDMHKTQQEPHRKRASMAELQRGVRFLSDEDIVKKRTA